MSDHRRGLIDVYARHDPDVHHQPQLHVHYAESVLRIKDGLPKMKDVPKEMGGSGQTLPELGRRLGGVGSLLPDLERDLDQCCSQPDPRNIQDRSEIPSIPKSLSKECPFKAAVLRANPRSP